MRLLVIRLFVLFSMVFSLLLLNSSAAFAATPMDPLLSFFNVERQALETVISTNAPIISNAGWTQFSAAQISLDQSPDTVAAPLDLSSASPDPMLLINTINALDVLVIGSPYIGYANGLGSVQNLFTVADNMVDLTLTPANVATEIRSIFLNVNQAGTMLGKLAKQDPELFKLLKAAIVSPTSFNKARFYADLANSNSSLSDVMGFTNAVNNSYQASQSYINSLDKLASAGMFLYSASTASDRYGNLTGPDAVKLYMQDRVLAAWKKLHPGTMVNPNLVVYKKAGGWLSFIRDNLIQEVIDVQDTSNDLYVDMASLYPLANNSAPNAFVNRAIPPPVVASYTGTATISSYVNSLNTTVSSFPIQSDAQINGDLYINN
jgi:hypothetical protein